MNKYVESVIEYVKTKYPEQPEFVQTVEEVFSSISDPYGRARAYVHLPRCVV